MPDRLLPAHRARRLLTAMVAMTLLGAAIAPAVPGLARAVEEGADHLVVSEVVTGGASASDELIELHNPTGAALPLEGLEVIYVTSSGATISRRAAWALGAPDVPAGGHVLVANEAGIYASVADAVYASGIAATGGSVAIRIQGASSAIDAVGWGAAASSWLEGTPVSAPPAGSSIERLPGGPAGSALDTGDNAADFVERAVPEPQNLGSAPTPRPGETPGPTATATSTPSATAVPTTVPSDPVRPTPAPTATATPPGAISVADAREALDGSTVTIEGVALTGSAFHDGGGFVADASGGIAVLPEAGSFDAGQLIRVTGEIDDRFSQRTLRPAAGAIAVLGSAADPDPDGIASGAIGEAVEGRLIRVAGSIAGSPTQLTSGLAFDLDDGSGPIRVLVGTATGIGTDGWVSGAVVDLVGIVGQRDSTGSGTEGYRVLPRSTTDVLSLTAPATPTPSPTGGAPSPSGSDMPGGGDVMTIAEARAAGPNARVRVRGVVTLPTGLVDDRTAVIQDGSGAILLRLGGDVGTLALGARIDASGTRSTLAGMETVRVNGAPESLGTSSQPTAVELSTGAAAESREAQLVVARGAVVTSARQSSRGLVSFEIDDGSGPLRVSAAPGAQLDRDPLIAGTWLEVRGVLGQETSRAEPNAGYRIWPRDASDVRVVAPATADPDGSSAGSGTGTGAAGGPEGGGGAATLAGVDSAGLASMRIGATLVVGQWKELGVGGVLWDGSRLVAIDAASGRIVARVTRGRSVPLALELGSLSAAGTDPTIDATRVRLGSSPSDTRILDVPAARPDGDLDGPLPAWVSLVGRLNESGSVLRIGQRAVSLELRCTRDNRGIADRLGDTVNVVGVAVDSPVRLIVPCGGLRSVPTLGGLARVAADADGLAPTLAPVTATATAEADPRRPSAALVLLSAAVALAAAAWLRHRRGEREPDEAAPAPAGGEEGPRLALVPVRNEHGS